jgi:hypothetical protein
MAKLKGEYGITYRMKVQKADGKSGGKHEAGETTRIDGVEYIILEVNEIDFGYNQLVLKRIGEV